MPIHWHSLRARIQCLNLLIQEDIQEPRYINLRVNRDKVVDLIKLGEQLKQPTTVITTPSTSMMVKEVIFINKCKTTKNKEAMA